LRGVIDQSPEGGTFKRVLGTGLLNLPILVQGANPHRFSPKAEATFYKHVAVDAFPWL